MPLKCHCLATDLPFWYFYPALGFHLALAIPVSCFDIYICDHGLGTRTEPQGSERGQCFHLALFVARFVGEHWENCPVWAFSTYAVGTALCYRLRQRGGGVRRWFSLSLETDWVFCMGGQYRITIFSCNLFLFLLRMTVLMWINVCFSNAFPVNIHYDRCYWWKNFCNECGFGPNVTAH